MDLNLNYTDTYILWYSEVGLCEYCKKKSKETGIVKGYCDICKEKHRLVVETIIHTRQEFQLEMTKGIIEDYNKLAEKLGLPNFEESKEILKNKLAGEDGDDSWQKR